jgi:hypothetical protein
MLIPQIYIIQKQSPKAIMSEFNTWATARADRVGKLGKKSAEDALGIPAQTHVQWDQGLQYYILTVVYLASEEELKAEGVL